MSLNAGASLSWGHGRATAAAGTPITVLVRPHGSRKSKLCKLLLTAGTTAHTLTVLTPQNTTTVVGVTAGGQAVVKLQKDPGMFSLNMNPAGITRSVADDPIAVGDWIGIQLPDGTQRAVQLHASTAPVTNADGTVTVTLAANLPAGGLGANSTVWFFGAPGDTDPNTGEPFPTFAIPASVTTTYLSEQGSLCETWGQNHPMLLYDNNATAAGAIEWASGVYGP